MKLASRDPGRRWQLNSKLQDKSWFEVATFAAYCMQCQNLHLKPWEDPPCWGSETPLGYHGDQREAWELQAPARCRPEPLGARPDHGAC